MNCTVFNKYDLINTGVGLCKPSTKDGPIIVSYSAGNCSQWTELETIRYKTVAEYVSYVSHCIIVLNKIKI